MSLEQTKSLLEAGDYAGHVDKLAKAALRTYPEERSAEHINNILQWMSQVMKMPASERDCSLVLHSCYTVHAHTKILCSVFLSPRLHPNYADSLIR